jgi:hypothetical protein
MRSRYGWHGRLAVATAVAATIGVAAAPANAASTVSLNGGTTTLKLDGKTTKALKRAGITISGSTAFKISGGTIDPANAKGTIDHKSAKLTLKAGKTKVTLSAITLNTDKGTASAKVGKKSVSFATVKGLKVTRRGFATEVSGAKVGLSKTGAAALNTAFKVRTFKAGTALGVASIAPTTNDIALERGTTRITFAPQVVQALAAGGVAPSAIAPATLDPATFTLSAPINGGVIDQRTLTGRITHEGGLQLGQIPLSNLEVVIGSPAVLKTSVGDIADLDLAGVQTTVDPATRAIGATGVILRLSSFGATAIGAVAPALAGRLVAGTPIGSGEFSATAR